MVREKAAPKMTALVFGPSISQLGLPILIHLHGQTPIGGRFFIHLISFIRVLYNIYTHTSFDALRESTFMFNIKKWICTTKPVNRIKCTHKTKVHQLSYCWSLLAKFLNPFAIFLKYLSSYSFRVLTLDSRHSPREIHLLFPLKHNRTVAARVAAYQKQPTSLLFIHQINSRICECRYPSWDSIDQVSPGVRC